MRRIVVMEYEDGWEFVKADGEAVRGRDALVIANRAADYGESLRGGVLGFIIKLRVGMVLVTLRARIF